MTANQVRDAFNNAETLPPLPEDAYGADAGELPDSYGHAAQYNGQGPEYGAYPGDDGPPPADPSADDPLAVGATFPLNDYGNGQRLIAYFGDDVRFVPRLGWYRWDGRRWRADEDELDVRRDAQKIAAMILAEIPFIALEEWQAEILDQYRLIKSDLAALQKKKRDELSDHERSTLSQMLALQIEARPIEEYLQKARAAHRGHAKNSGNTSKITNMLQEARGHVAMAVNELNADPLMVNCENGVLHFSQVVDEHDAGWGDDRPKWRVDLLPHDRRRLITKMAAAEYHPEAQAPVWQKFLEVVQPDPEVRAFLQRWFGYSITGLTTEQKLAFFYGVGRNGKSTAVDIIAKIVADYGTTIPIETLTGSEQRKGSDATPDLVRLPGARMVRASEPEQGQRMKEALIKALTGGEAIMIRRMQQEFVEITPEFKLTISGNHKPEIRGADDGIWRRVALVDFPAQIAAADVDRGLPQKLWAERDGILAWCVAGAIDYLNNGLNEPASVIQATEDYRKDSDPLRVFLTEECEITGNGDHFETGRDLADAFNGWLLSRADTTWGKRTIANQLKARAGLVKGPNGEIFTPGKISDTGYRGVRIKDDARDRIAQYGDELRSASQRRG